MTSYQQLLDIGETFESFVSRGLPAEREAVRAMQDKLNSQGTISAVNLARVHALDGPLHLLVAAEMWCPDCQINVTVMDYLQRVQPKIQLKIIGKGRAEHALKQRLTLERISIPLALVLNENWQLIGRFVEQPQAVSLGGDAVRADYRAGAYLEHTLRELLDTLESA